MAVARRRVDPGWAHRARFAVYDAHDRGEALAAERAAAPVVPQHDRALKTQPTVAALEEDRVGWPLHAHDAGAAVFGCIRAGLLCAGGILADSADECRQIVMPWTAVYDRQINDLRTERVLDYIGVRSNVRQIEFSFI